MATVVLSAAGAAVGSAIGGTFLGISATAIGRFAGALIGTRLDQQVMGEGSQVIRQNGRQLERIRVTRSGEGAAMPRVWGRMRVSGHVIWATNFRERVNVTRTTTGGGGGGRGKGGPSKPRSPKVTTERRDYSYSVSLAIALCEGEISNVSRVWADGVELETARLNVRVYKGSQDQLPDPKIEAVEGAGTVPGYRGTAYVVFEDLDLTPFGNRVPQFSFEVGRPVQREAPGAKEEVPFAVEAVAVMPGTGEYALATTKVHYGEGISRRGWANVSQPTGKSDFSASLDQLENELPNVGAGSLIVSWFGDDLRAGQCRLRPKVASKDSDGNEMPWRVSGLTRASADEVPADAAGRPVYGGTPSDQSIVEAIAALRARGIDTMFYPFVLMEQGDGNGLPDPYSDAGDQPKLPWRGRITTAKAPGQAGSTDGTAAAEAEVAAFFGTASAGDFSIMGGQVSYAGPAEFSYRRFILHYAHLCALAGGVDAFCIGSEMRGLTQIRGTNHTFPAVEALRLLAQECRAILGPGTKISYAADWSEYFGYHPQDGSGNVYFHLDPLWSDPVVDFVGIDNYMPLSDWRDGDDHADADWGAVYSLDYLKANVAGGEGYDWYYASQNARDVQRRSEITDGAYDEPWVFRYKDIRNWWMRSHHNRIDGVRQEVPTDWEPQSKPIWFTEYGCAAIDKGSNEPNKFLDPKSSESGMPAYSNGQRDELIQRQYVSALNAFWGDEDNNPVSVLYNAPMVDMTHAFLWAWDARPYPWFPRSVDLWSDGENYARGHWINGRATSVTLASLVTELCLEAGVRDFDVSELHGYVRGYLAEGVSDMRAALEPLMVQYGFDAVERDGVLTFQMRDGRPVIDLDPARFAVVDELDGRLTQTRASSVELADRVQMGFIEADADYAIASVEASVPGEMSPTVAETEVALSLTRAEGRQAAERFLSETRIAREKVSFALPPSQRHIGAGDVVAFEGVTYRIDRVNQGITQVAEAVRVERDVYGRLDVSDELVRSTPYQAPLPVSCFFLDLPLLTGDEVPHAPFVAATANPWPGSAAIYASPEDAGYELELLLSAAASVGVTETPLFAAAPGRLDRGSGLQVRFSEAELASVQRTSLLNGANTAVIGDGSTGNWEVFQFETAELIDVNTYLLRGRLRGQAGSDGIMPGVWPVGSWVVILDGALQQLPLSAAQRGVSRYYRVGPGGLPVDDPTFETRIDAFDGNGLRPYRPAHLRVRDDAGDLVVTWVRRTRIDGDSWENVEVPLGEEREEYVLRVRDGTQIVREDVLTSPAYTYTSTDQGADGFGAGFVLEVAQLSMAYGPGPFAQWVA